MRGEDKWCPENDAAYRAELAEMHRYRSSPYTTPADCMAPLAAVLARAPTTMIPALIAALDALRGRGDTRKITEMLAKEAAK